MLYRWIKLPENMFPGTHKYWLLKLISVFDFTCQKESVLGNPLNWLEQIVLEGQTSTAGAHLKEIHKISNNSVVVKGSSKRKHHYKELLITSDKLYLKGVTTIVLYCTKQQAFPCVEDACKINHELKDITKHSYSRWIQNKFFCL